MIQLITILLALIFGYCCKRLPLSYSLLEAILTWCMIFILFLMGYLTGASTNHLLALLYTVGKTVLSFSVLLLLFNSFALGLFSYACHRIKPMEKSPRGLGRDDFKALLASGKYVLLVLLGIILGYWLQWHFTFLNLLIDILLLVILFIIGFQLRQQALPLRVILFHKIGLMVAIIVTLSSLLAGGITAVCLHLTVKQGMILSSGFGWYSLSGILTGQVLSHQFGTIAFFIDFIREFIAIALISLIGRRASLVPIGYSGATALDFTLPMIKMSIGESAVPIAMTSGFVLTLLVPLLILAIAHIS